jgi:hypothetical protein
VVAKTLLGKVQPSCKALKATDPPYRWRRRYFFL